MDVELLAAGANFFVRRSNVTPGGGSGPRRQALARKPGRVAPQPQAQRHPLAATELPQPKAKLGTPPLPLMWRVRCADTRAR